MIPLIGKPTTHDLFDSIIDQYCYPDLNAPIGSPGWWISEDIQDERTIPCMALEEQFVESVTKSKDLPFTFEKSFQGTILKKESRLGKQFYELLRLQNERANTNPSILPTTFKISNGGQFKHYEVSEHLNILYAVATALDLNRANFNYNPMSEIGGPGLLEGELINSFVTRLREATKQKSVKAKLDERKKASTQCFTKTKRYLDRLYANSPALFGVHMVLYFDNQDAPPMTIKESDTYILNYLNLFENDSRNDFPIGWWWKREYMTELGYHYHLILFFDGHYLQYDPTNIGHSLGYEWGSITKHRGKAFTILPPENDPIPFTTANRLEPLTASIQRMVLRDTFLRLKSDPKFGHLDMGILPKLFEELPPQTRPSIIPPRPSRFSAPN